MASCLPVYGTIETRSSAGKLWNSLKLEIFQPTDSVTGAEALKTTRVLIETVYALDGNDAGIEATEIQGLAHEACKECIQILQEPEKSQAKPAIKILCTFVSTTPSLSRYTLSQAVPHLVKLFRNPDEITNRAPILKLLCDLIAAARESMKKAMRSEGSLMPFKDEMLGVMTVGLKSPATRLPALAGLKEMASTKYLLTDEEAGHIVQNVNEVLQAAPDKDNEDTDAALELLAAVSATSLHHVEEQTLPLLFSFLPDQPPPRRNTSEWSNVWRALYALTHLCLLPALFETLVIRLTAKLDLICAPSKFSQDTDIEPTAAYVHSILMTLANTLNKKVAIGHSDVAEYIDRLVPRLYYIFIHSALQPDGNDMVATNSRLITAATQIITLVAGTLDQKKQQEFAVDLFALYLTSNFKGIFKSQREIALQKTFFPFKAGAPILQKNLVALFAAGVCSLGKEIYLPCPDICEFLHMLMAWGLEQAENNHQRDAAWHLVSTVVNKRADDVSAFLSEQLVHYWTARIADHSITRENHQHAIRSWIWLSKALIIRSHPLSLPVTERLFEVFGDDSMNFDAARAVGEIGGSDTILTRRNRVVVKVLYVQKYLNSVLPRIVEGVIKSSTQERTAYLIALTSLIKSTPKTTYMHEIPSLLPCLLRGLDLSDHDIRANVIDTFIGVAEGESLGQSTISEHASTLVYSMILNSMVQEIPSVRLRLAALRYLGMLPSIVRYDVLHPHKRSVIRELAKVLDDPKRSVRKEAVDTRTTWFKYNG